MVINALKCVDKGTHTSPFHSQASQNHQQLGMGYSLKKAANDFGSSLLTQLAVLIFFCFIPMKISQSFLGQLGLLGWVKIFMIILVSSRFLAKHNITLYGVYMCFLWKTVQKLF